MNINNLYTYKATCTNVVDGDTIDILIDYGFDTYAKRRVRLLGVDTPERGQDKFKEATAAFDEIKEYTLDKIETLTTRQEFAPNSNDFEYFGNLLTAFKAVKNKISDLECGNDGHN